MKNHLGLELTQRDLWRVQESLYPHVLRVSDLEALEWYRWDDPLGQAYSAKWVARCLVMHPVHQFYLCGSGLVNPKGAVFRGCRFGVESWEYVSAWDEINGAQYNQLLQPVPTWGHNPEKAMK